MNLNKEQFIIETTGMTREKKIRILRDKFFNNKNFCRYQFKNSWQSKKGTYKSILIPFPLSAVHLIQTDIILLLLDFIDIKDFCTSSGSNFLDFLFFIYKFTRSGLSLISEYEHIDTKITEQSTLEIILKKIFQTQKKSSIRFLLTQTLNKNKWTSLHQIFYHSEYFYCLPIKYVRFILKNSNLQSKNFESETPFKVAFDKKFFNNCQLLLLYNGVSSNDIYYAFRYYYRKLDSLQYNYGCIKMFKYEWTINSEVTYFFSLLFWQLLLKLSKKKNSYYVWISKDIRYKKLFITIYQNNILKSLPSLSNDDD